QTSYKAILGQPSFRIFSTVERLVLEEIKNYQIVLKNQSNVSSYGDFNRNDIKKPQVRDLKTILDYTGKLLDVKGEEDLTLLDYAGELLGVKSEEDLTFAGVHNQWGISFDNPLLEAIANAFVLEKGNLDPFTSDPNTYTQEAIMDDPWIAIERAFLEWQ